MPNNKEKEEEEMLRYLPEWVKIVRALSKPDKFAERLEDRRKERRQETRCKNSC